MKKFITHFILTGILVSCTFVDAEIIIGIGGVKKDSQAYRIAKALGDAIAYEQSHKWQGQGGGDWIVYGDF